MKTFKTMKTLQGALLGFAFLALSGCSSTAYKIDRQATAAAPWKVGEVLATTVDKNDDGNSSWKGACFINGEKGACDYERVFLGVSKEGHYLVQDFYTAKTVQQYLKDAGDKRIKRTDPYLLSDKATAQSSPFLPATAVTAITGRITAWYLTGQKKFEGEVKNGLRQGLWEGWYENGQLYFDFTYSKGYRHGHQKSWYPNGQMTSSEHYVDGKEDGLFELWNPDGQMVARNSYVMGKRHGKQEEWFANGQLYVIANFIDGERDGADQWWWYGDDGKLNAEGRQVSYAEAKQLLLQYNEEQKKLKQAK